MPERIYRMCISVEMSVCMLHSVYGIRLYIKSEVRQYRKKVGVLCYTSFKIGSKMKKKKEIRRIWKELSIRDHRQSF